MFNNISFGSKVLPSPLLEKSFEIAKGGKPVEKSSLKMANDFYKAMDSFTKDGKDDVIKFEEENISGGWYDIKALVNDKVAFDARFYGSDESEQNWLRLLMVNKFAQKRNPELKKNSFFIPVRPLINAKLEKLEKEIFGK